MRVQERLGPALSRVLVLLTISVVVNYIDRGTLSTAASLVKDELSLNAAQLGALFSSFFWAYAAFMVVAGWLADRYDPALVLALGFVLWCIATVGTGLVHSFLALIVVRLALGMGESVSWPCYCSLISRTFSEQRRGIANSAVAIGMGLGPAVGMFVSGIMMARLGWRIVFVLMGSIGMLWIPAWLKWKPRAVPRLAPADEYAPGFLDILKQRSAWGTFVGTFSHLYLWYLLLTWTPFYLLRARHYSMDRMAVTTGVAYFCTTICSLLSGWTSDLWIASGASPNLVRKTFIGIGQIGSGIAFLFCTSASSTISLIALLLSFGFYGAYIGHIWAVTQTLAGPRGTGRWMGVQNFVGSFAGIAAPWVTGIIVNRTENFFWPFAITATLVVFGTLWWFVMVGRIEPIRWAEQQPRSAGVLAKSA